MQWLDCSFSRPNYPACKAADYGGVIRYISYNNGKDAFPDEIAQILAAGLDLAFVFEGGTGNALQGAAQGALDGGRAAVRLAQLDAPRGMTVFAAVDQNVSQSDWPAIDAYCDAFFAQIAGYTPGGYFESDLMEHALDTGRIKVGWFPGATSWSSGRISPRSSLIQRVGSPISGTDVNDLMTAFPTWRNPGLALEGGGTLLQPDTSTATPTAPTVQEDDMPIITVPPGATVTLRLPANCTGIGLAGSGLVAAYVGTGPGIAAVRSLSPHADEKNLFLLPDLAAIDFKVNDPESGFHGGDTVLSIENLYGGDKPAYITATIS
jgi:hypothetical protein